MIFFILHLTTSYLCFLSHKTYFTVHNIRELQFQHVCRIDAVAQVNEYPEVFISVSGFIFTLIIKNGLQLFLCQSFLSSFFSSSILARMALFRVLPVAFPKRKLSILKENVPFYARASTFIRTKDPAACSILLSSCRYQ